ncbi:hypothetical protein PG996_002796 [Apiospora saccharicola]|uniref:Uncharacterized protein n=1 Tax=Apiospora saccharicola TaxID=335842 RepID=A0ABR1WKH2_9PEZI
MRKLALFLWDQAPAGTTPMGGGVQIFKHLLLEVLYEYQTQPDQDSYANMIVNLKPTNNTFMLILVYLKPEIRATVGEQGGTVVAAVQPISASASAIRAGRTSNGGGVGNALGLQEEDYNVPIPAAYSLRRSIREAAIDAGVALDFLFMNDAHSGRQPVTPTYGGDNVRRLKEVQRLCDPNLVFLHLVSGVQKIILPPDLDQLSRQQHAILHGGL